jgi:hypothetical protein
VGSVPAGSNKLFSFRLVPLDLLFNRNGAISPRIKLSAAAAIQERVTAVLRSIPNEAFADSFQKLYEHCQPCVVKDDDYFEGQ